MATLDRNEFLRATLAAGAASFASSVAANYTAHLEPIDPAVVSALENIKRKADAIAEQVEAALPLG